MRIQPIRNEEDLDRAFVRLEALWGAEEGSPEAKELEELSILIERYEDENHPIGTVSR